MDGDAPVQVNIREAKTHLSKLLARVRGEEIIIAKAGYPIARLVPVAERPARRLPGSAKGKVTIASDFDAPLPEAILAEFER
ncbi:type II toxin-antitoxin system Phd/YefM family antitoxin [Candidatus Bipolaricaulota bacterium]|nr:type II toxin-antitoxin system Phd/YefM family antitoxin [Candidatus Bipolaricaulota bacterium]